MAICKQKVWRYCPFSWYDTFFLENWLENLAKKGLFLSTTGFIGPFAKLEKRESGNMHYQVISSLPRTKNDNDMLQMIRDVGWHYVCTEGLADIYATDQIDLEDLHSEADIQWMDVKSMFKYRIVSLILLFLAGPGVTFFQFWKECHSGLDNLGAHYYMNVICGVLMIIFYAISCVLLMYSYHVTKKYLICNHDISHQNYKKYGNQKIFFRVCSWGSVIVMILLCVIMNIF